MSFGLVIVAAIALVIGLLQSGLAIIYVSIGCSLVAAAVLAFAVLRGRPEPAAAGAPPARPAYQGGPPPPAPAPGSWQAPPSPAVAAPGPSAPPEPAAAPPAPPPPSPAPAPPPPPPEREPALAGATTGAGASGAATADRTEQLDQAAIQGAVAADGFPIHDYESLRATEILPMLAELDTDQLQQVREHEAAGKNRFMILSRIDDEMESRGAGPWEVDEEGWQEEEVAEPVAPTRAPSGEFPIPDYQELGALQVLGRLNDLDAAELEAVREREQMGSRRSMVLNRIERLLAESDRRVTVPAVPADGAGDGQEQGAAGEETGPSGAPPASGRRAAGTRKRAATTKKAGRPAKAAKAPPAKRGAATRGRGPAAAPPAKRGGRRKAAGAAKSGAATAETTPAKRSATKAAKATPGAKRSGGVKKTAKKAGAAGKRPAKRR